MLHCVRHTMVEEFIYDCEEGNNSRKISDPAPGRKCCLEQQIMSVLLP